MTEFGSSRRGITFSQAEGIVPLPQQLAPKQLNQRARNKIWSVMIALLEQCKGENVHFEFYVDQPMVSIFREYWSDYLDKPIDEFGNNYDYVAGWVKNVIFNGKYNEVFDLLQLILQRLGNYPDWRAAIASSLDQGGSAYRVVDDDLIVPVASGTDAAAIAIAFNTLTENEFKGARFHLRKAAQELSVGDWGRTVAESMQAVESVVRMIADAGTLNEAIKKLDKAGAIHGGLKIGLEKLYAYTSDEQGIRHSLLEQDGVKVDETDALFMFGACAAFVTYVIGKGRALGLIKE